MVTNKFGPLVPVRVERLRAALRIRRMPVLQLAERAGLRQQTIDFIVRDESGKRRCREAHLRAMADVLDVDFDYLTGKIDRLRYARTSYERDEDGFHLFADTSDPEQLAGIHLAEDRFGRRCYAAIIRDLIALHGGRRKAEEAYLKDNWWMLFEGLMQMIRPGTWRAAVLKAPRRPVRSRTRVADMEREGLEALAKGFEVVLAPWLDGGADLDVKALGALRRAVTDGWKKHHDKKATKSRKRTTRRRTKK